jgi:hypothetical protein
MTLKERNLKLWNGFIWLRTGESGRFFSAIINYRFP